MALAPTPLAQIAPPNDAFKNPVQLAWMQGLLSGLRDALSNAVSRDTAVPYITLTAPNGASYKVTVGNDGSLTATAIIRG